MNYFDANTWIGRWPFALAPGFTAPTLVRHLKRNGIARALVSSMEAVLQPEPGPANRALLRATRAESALLPVPVINPALPNWADELAVCAADPRVRAVRLLPRYHNYRLNAPSVTALLAALTKAGIRPIVSARLVDERHEYFALRIKPVAVSELEIFLAAHHEAPVLVSGLLRSELMPLAAKHPHLLADLSFAEWDNTIIHLLAQVAAAQLVFASHTPFLLTAAAIAKLGTSPIANATRGQIASDNLGRFLKR